jgi:hypothetical protein
MKAMQTKASKAAATMPGTDPSMVATRVCNACHYRLSLDYFRMPGSKTCFVCGDAKRQARGWTVPETARLLEASRGILDLWNQYYDRWSDEDLILWRALLTAVDRLPSGLASRDDE